jgi:hypothetical protein
MRNGLAVSEDKTKRVRAAAAKLGFTVAWAPDDATADRALLAKAALFAELGRRGAPVR